MTLLLFVVSFVHFQGSSPSKPACCASGKDIISGHLRFIQNVLRLLIPHVFILFNRIKVAFVLFQKFTLLQVYLVI